MSAVQRKELRANADDVKHAYRLILGRDPDAAGYAHFCRLVAESDISTRDLAARFLASEEFKGRTGSIPSAPIASPVDSPRLACSPCRLADIESENFVYWASKLREMPGRPHRKLWEWCYIVQALHERGKLAESQRGLGFAVGQEPLTALFAAMGCDVLATDLAYDLADEERWVSSDQHASDLSHLNRRAICLPELFQRRVGFRDVDMRAIPSDLGVHDFLWSSCAIEHLGSLKHGMDFVIDAMRCLKPGGVAVHTTELNCDSNERTLETGHDVIFRKRDLLELGRQLEELGHQVEPFDFTMGTTEADRFVDEPPYQSEVHLKLRIGGFASTSFGLIVTARGA